MFKSVIISLFCISSTLAIFPEELTVSVAKAGAGCTHGKMECSAPNSKDFKTCNYGTWVTQQCGPGTFCNTVGGNLQCGFKK